MIRLCRKCNHLMVMIPGTPEFFVCKHCAREFIDELKRDADRRWNKDADQYENMPFRQTEKATPP